MVLMDTHIWWWCLAEPENLSKKVKTLIQRAKTDERFISSISIWEFAMMVATARVHNLTLLTKDQRILDYPHVRSTW